MAFAKGLMAFGLLSVFLSLFCASVNAQTPNQIVVTMSSSYPGGTSFAFVPLNKPYDVTVNARIGSPGAIVTVGVRSTQGTTTAPSLTNPNVQWGPWYTFNGSGSGPTLIHTFNVVNQSYGYFWWEGGGWGYYPGGAIPGFALWGYMQT